MSDELPYGLGHRMLTLDQVCEWFHLTEQAVRSRVKRRTIPFRQLGDGPKAPLRFDEQELVLWTQPKAPTRMIAIEDLAPRKRRPRGSSPRTRSGQGGS